MSSNSSSETISVSAVIPVYNAEAFIGEAVESLLAQTYPLREIVCVDDGSTDGTSDILLDLARASAGRVHILEGGHRGASAARNTGMADATGDYIQFLDADDFLLPDKIEQDVKRLADDRAAILFGSHVGYEGDEKIYERRGFPSTNPWVSLVRQGFGHTSANLFRRDLVERAGGWDESRPFAQEYDLIARILQIDEHVVFAHHHATIVRRHPASISYIFTPEMRRARLRIDGDVLRYLRSAGAERTVTSEVEDAILMQLRGLYQMDRAAAVTLHDEILGPRHRPVASRSNRTGYCLAYRLLGFERAERLKSAMGASIGAFR